MCRSLWAAAGFMAGLLFCCWRESLDAITVAIKVGSGYTHVVFCDNQKWQNRRTTSIPDHNTGDHQKNNERNQILYGLRLREVLLQTYFLARTLKQTEDVDLSAQFGRAWKHLPSLIWVGANLWMHWCRLLLLSGRKNMRSRRRIVGHWLQNNLMHGRTKQ